MLDAPDLHKAARAGNVKPHLSKHNATRMHAKDHVDTSFNVKCKITKLRHRIVTYVHLQEFDFLEAQMKHKGLCETVWVSSCILSPASAEGQRVVLLLRNQRLQPLFLTAVYYQVTVASWTAALCGAAGGIMLYTVECTLLYPPAVDLWCRSWPGGPLGSLASDCYRYWFQ